MYATINNTIMVVNAVNKFSIKLSISTFDGGDTAAGPNNAEFGFILLSGSKLFGLFLILKEMQGLHGPPQSTPLSP